MSDLAELDALFDADDGEEFSLGGLSPEIDEQLCPEAQYAELERKMAELKKKMMNKKEKGDESKQLSNTQKPTVKTLLSNVANENGLFAKAANENAQSLTQPLGGVKRRIGCAKEEVRRKQMKTTNSDTLFCAKKKPVESVKVDVEKYSRIRLKTRTLEANELKDRMEGKLYIKCCMIDKMRQQIRKNDWVTIGVIVKKLNPQQSKNNKLYSILELADLDETVNTVTLFLFGKVHSALFREIGIGDVVGILNPTIMPPKNNNNNSSNTPALTIDVKERLLKIGSASDLAWCKAMNKFTKNKCKNFINKQYGDYCMVHVQQQYKQTSRRRNDLQGMAQAPAQKKNLWHKHKNDQFFYGGQLYNAKPPSAAKTSSVKLNSSQTKLTAAFSNKLKSSSQKFMNAQEQKEAETRAKVMKSLAGLEEGQKLSGCSKSFEEMLGSGDNPAGTKLYLNFLKKKMEKEQQQGGEKNESSTIEKLKQLKARLAEEKSKSTQALDKIEQLKQRRLAEFKQEKIKNSSNNAEMKENTKVRNVPGSKAFNVSTQQRKRLEKEREMKRKSLDHSEKDDYKSHQHANNMRRPKGAVDMDKVADEMVRLKKERMVKRKLKQLQGSKGELNKQTNSNGVAAEVTRLKKERKFQRDNLPASMESSNMIQSKLTSNFIATEKYKKSLTNALGKMTKPKTSAVAAFASLSSKNNEHFVGLAGDGFNNGFLPKSKTRITAAEFKKMRALAKLKDKHGKVNLEVSEEKRKEKINKLVEHDVRLSQVGGKTHLKIGGKRQGLSLGGEKFEESKVAAKKPSAITNMLSDLLGGDELGEEKFKEICSAQSKNKTAVDQDELVLEEKYFNARIKKDTFELQQQNLMDKKSKIVTCHKCNYTFWSPRPSCHDNHKHSLTWRECTKRWWQCGCCGNRTTTWTVYPLTSCSKCGGDNKWERCAAMREIKGKSPVKVRGEEHGKFLNALPRHLDNTVRKDSGCQVFGELGDR